MAKDSLERLRQAVRRAPDNIPLRQHLAESLLERGHAAEAEQEYRAALAIAPRDPSLKVGLARAFAEQDKDSEASVVLEELLKHRDVPAEAYLINAELLLRAGDVERAVAQYKAAVEDDPSLADPEFADRLGITAEDEFDDEFGEIVDGRMRLPWDDPAADIDLTVERPSVRFGDVGGMEALKEEIRLKIIYPLQHAEMFAAYGKQVGGGILLYGAPGCGKTHLARATAGEINAAFLSVGINDVLDMWIGNSEKNLHGIFEQARRSKPCVLFFDEVDALGARRSDMRTSGGRHLINMFLAELDGINAGNDGLLILAATNAPWHLDPAFRRPGRFDRVLFVPPPDGPAREEILRILCREKPSDDVDYRQVAKKTDRFSGADLKAVVDLAVESKLQEAMKTGIVKPLTTRDLIAAAKRHRPTTEEWFSTARNHALYSNQGGVYDEILRYLNL